MTGIGSPFHPFCSSKLYSWSQLHLSKNHTHRSFWLKSSLIFTKVSAGHDSPSWFFALTTTFRKAERMTHRYQWNWFVEVLILDPNGCSIEFFLNFFPASSYPSTTSSWKKMCPDNPTDICTWYSVNGEVTNPGQKIKRSDICIVSLGFPVGI